MGRSDDVIVHDVTVHGAIACPFSHPDRKRERTISVRIVAADPVAAEDNVNGQSARESHERYLDLLKRCLAASLYDESGWRVIDSDRSPKERRLRRPLRFIRALIRSFAVRIARRQSLLLVEDREFLPEDREEGRDWPCFGYTMVGHRRLDNIQECVETVLRDEIPGDLVETGVWRGGGSIFMRAVLKAHGVTDRRVWAADSFDGFPKPVSNDDDTDMSHVQYLKVSLDDVRGAFDRFGLLDDQVCFLPGWFHETLPSAPIERIAVLRLDGDLYSSTMSALRALYPRVSPGGYVIVDDYYSWESCRRAVTEFLETENLTPDIRRIDWTGAFWRVDSEGSRS